MKKMIGLLLALMLLFAFPVALGETADLVAQGEALTHDELVELAKGETGTFVGYGNTSRITTALEEFGALYDIPVEGNNLKDSEIYEKLSAELSGSVKGADVVMIQDGSSLKSEAMAFGYVVNFIPAAYKDSIAENDQNPLVQQYINKVFIWNNIGDEAPAITNVWQLTVPEMKGHVIFKSPETEQVNMNFLAMVTNEYWSEKLAEAYAECFGEEIVLDGFKNAGYKWVAEFLSNCTFINSDTTIAEEISQESASGKIGLFVLSKLRSSSVYTDNLTVGQYLAQETGEAIVPFSGFMYPMYAMVTSHATRPYTAMLFVEYLMGPEGFSPWGKSIGAYSGNASLLPIEDDLPIEAWKETLVMEDPDFISENIDDVYTFVIKYIQ